MKTKPNSDSEIMKALRSGLSTSTEIATATGMVERLVQLALVRLMDGGRVVRSKTATSYEWRIA